MDTDEHRFQNAIPEPALWNHGWTQINTDFKNLLDGTADERRYTQISKICWWNPQMNDQKINSSLIPNTQR
jgi:hypothetical protein